MQAHKHWVYISGLFKAIAAYVSINLTVLKYMKITVMIEHLFRLKLF